MARILSRKQTKKISRTRLQCESLEDRRLLAVVTDQVSLEAAIAVADPAIVFGNDIATTSQVVIDMDGVNIDGAGFSLTGAGNHRILQVNDGAAGNINVSIRNLTITGGSASSGGGIVNTENLTLNNVDVTANVAYQANPNYAAFGGGILNTTSGYAGYAGNLTIEYGSSVSGNTAYSNTVGGVYGFGGGIASIGYDTVLTVTDSTVDGNVVEGSGGGIFHRLGKMTVTGSMITNNTADFGPDASVSGGGIAAYSQGPGNTYSPLDITISGSTISGNVGDSEQINNNTFPYGGGIYARGYGTVTLNMGTVVANNTITGANTGAYFVLARGGGAFFSADDNAGPLNVYVDDVTFTNNVGDVHGAGLATRARTAAVANIDIRNSTFSGGSSGYGGSGVFLWAPAQSTNPANVYLYNSTIKDGTGSGGVRNWFGGYAEIVKSTISGNSGSTSAVDNVGVALSNGENAPTTVLRQSTVSGNYSTGTGGGVQNYDGYFRAYQSTLSGNNGGVGGGIYAATYSGYVGSSYEATTYLNGVTIKDNTAQYAGGGWGQNPSHGTAAGSCVIANTAIDANYDGLFPVAPDFYDRGSTNCDLNYTLVSNTYGSALPQTDLSNKYDVPAGLSPLGDYGGPTLTHYATSPASNVVDMGDPAVVGGMDQRMYDRVYNGRVDIGSTEYGSGGNVKPCDIDGDGDCDIDDLDMLVMNNIDYDGNSIFERADIQLWLVEAGANPGNAALTGGCPFLEGDFDLNGVVDGQDFIRWNGSKFSATGKYSMGDANGDGVTDGQDFVIWNGNKFTASIGSCPLTAPNGGHDAVAMNDGGSGSGQALRRLGKDTSHTEYKLGDGASVSAALQSTRHAAVVDKVIQFAPAAVTESAIAAKVEDIRLSGIALKAAETTALRGNYSVKSMDVATARASDAHEAVDKVFADLS